MTDERREATSNGEIDPMTGAQIMSDWFPDYLYGLIDKPGLMPSLTALRLRRQFGPGDPHQQIEVIRDSLMIFDEVHQSNLALYFCGYPDEALEMLQDEETISSSIKMLDAQIVPYKEDIAVEMPSDALDGETTADYLHRKRQERQDRLEQQRIAKADRQKEISIGVVATSRLATSGDNRELRTTGIVNLGKAVLPDDHPLAWQNDALCAEVDPELFFPEKGGSTRDAKRICTSCDVKLQCLEYALANDERFGIWGGQSDRFRRDMRLKGISARDVIGSDAATQILEDYSSAPSSGREIRRSREALLVEPFQRQHARSAHFLRIIEADSDTSDLLTDHPELMARAAYSLLAEAYPADSKFEEVHHRRKRLVAYFLDKKWNKYQEEYGDHAKYWDLLTKDLTEFTEVARKMLMQHQESAQQLTFAEFHLDNWTPGTSDDVLVSVVVEKKPKWVKDWLKGRVDGRKTSSIA